MKSNLRILILLACVAVWGALNLDIAHGQTDPTASESSSAAAPAPTPDAPTDAGPKASSSDAGDPESSASPPEDALGQAAGAAKAYQSQEWALMVGFICMLLGSLFRLALGYAWEFWKSALGGYLTAGFAGLSATGYAIVSSGGFTAAAAIAGLTAMSIAMGWSSPLKAFGRKVAPNT